MDSPEELHGEILTGLMARRARCILGLRGSSEVLAVISVHLDATLEEAQHLHYLFSSSRSGHLS